MAHGDETQAQFAQRIAATTASVMHEIVSMPPGTVEPLDLAVRIAVLRAFGCQCTPGRAMAFALAHETPPATYFEDIMCELHGLGPLQMPPGERGTREDPGS